MCFWNKKPEQKPDWITQSRKVVAQAERDAAAIHYTYMQLIEDGSYPDNTSMGSYEHHKYWWQTHLEAAWYMENGEVQ